MYIAVVSVSTIGSHFRQNFDFAILLDWVGTQLCGAGASPVSGISCCNNEHGDKVNNAWWFLFQIDNMRKQRDCRG